MIDRHRLVRALGLTVAIAALAAPAVAQTVVAPNAYANVAGDSPQYLVFGLGSNTGMFQVAFAASQFASVPIGASITGIGFRLRQNGFARDTSYADFTLAIGTTAAGYQNLTSVYLANQGADTVTARSGALTIDPSTLVTSQAVNPFFTLAFTTPYTYRGGDLLITTNFVSTLKPELGVDAVAVGGATNTVGGGVGVGGANTYNAPIVQLLYSSMSAVPEPASWMLMIGGFGCIGFALRSRRRVVVG